jgi:hypothetical protein
MRLICSFSAVETDVAVLAIFSPDTQELGIPSPLHLPGRLADSLQCTFPWEEGCIDGVLEPFTVFLISRLVSHVGGGDSRVNLI